MNLVPTSHGISGNVVHLLPPMDIRNCCAAQLRFGTITFPFLFPWRMAYFAIQKDDMILVCGEEPEYEESTPIADSLFQFINKIASGSPELSRLI